jgi:lipopolysaccharide biosynthesis glycosyltransferase
MLHSLSKHVLGFAESRLKIFYNCHFSKLGFENQLAILAICPHAELEEIHQPRYELGSLNDEFHRPAFLTLEAFRQEESDQVIFFDSDMMCLRDFSEILTQSYDFAATRCRSNGGIWLNTGFFVINQRLIGRGIYDDLLDRLPMDHGHMIDQPLINGYIAESKAKVLELESFYNYLYVGGHPEVPGDERYLVDLPNIRVLHWAGRVGRRIKPWDPGAPDFPSLRRWKVEESEMLEKLKYVRAEL